MFLFFAYNISKSKILMRVKCIPWVHGWVSHHDDILSSKRQNHQRYVLPLWNVAYHPVKKAYQKRETIKPTT